MPDLAPWRHRLMALAQQGATDDGAHDLAHLHRVWANACALMAEAAEAPAEAPIDALVVLAACYLHDLVNLPKNDPRRHQASRLSAERAVALLGPLGFPPEKLDAVAHAIAAHSFSAGIPPRSREAAIVQDADRLDALGAVGLARLCYTAGRLGSALAHPTDPAAAATTPPRPLDDQAYALDHIEVKLARLPGLMQTAAGRRLGEARLAELRAFRQRFVAESGAESCASGPPPDQGAG